MAEQPHEALGCTADSGVGAVSSTNWLYDTESNVSSSPEQAQKVSTTVDKTKIVAPRRTGIPPGKRRNIILSGTSRQQRQENIMHSEASCASEDCNDTRAISLHRKTYLEALQTTSHGKAPIGVVIQPSRTRCPLPSMSEPNIEYDDDENEGMFDAFFVLEGVKEARGGLRARMFKGEGKTQRFYKASRQGIAHTP